ncbi:hypothetical protein IP90_00789 [Luteimonas cucumeris]|uniref:DUF4189 domain-containing protein n=1 Tax=Luteimonas cucumeris TaxID=985012 RepID=A0A562LAR9_9GAMM|nr:hypothetical protein [Luteimonas cucumeris]TWI04656.1 hypothetical protein IP90_00789 [Luteimonas cucumeris]
MKMRSAAIAMAFLLSVTGSALAAVVHVSGSGLSYDPGLAMEMARADAIAKCEAQAGTPLEEVYTHISRNNYWSASSIWTCEVP